MHFYGNTVPVVQRGAVSYIKHAFVAVSVGQYYPNSIHTGGWNQFPLFRTKVGRGETNCAAHFITVHHVAAQFVWSAKQFGGLSTLP